MYNLLSRKERHTKFIQLQAKLKVKNIELAKIFCVCATTIARWRMDINPIPTSVLFTMDLILLRRNLGFPDLPE